MLSLTPQSDPEAVDWIAQIASSAKVKGQMVGDLLDFTQTRLGASIPTPPSPMEMGSLCRQVFNEFAAGHPKVKMHFSAETALTGNWDFNRLRQAVSNLLANAIQHRSADAPVRLSVIAQDSDVLVEVCNGGLAIPQADLVRILDPLVQGSSKAPPRLLQGSSSESMRQGQPGSIWLGLYIAREVVIAHGGAISVASSKVAGTIFTMRFPRSGASTRPESVSIGTKRPAA